MSKCSLNPVCLRPTICMPLMLLWLQKVNIVIIESPKTPSNHLKWSTKIRQSLSSSTNSESLGCGYCSRLSQRVFCQTMADTLHGKRNSVSVTEVQAKTWRLSKIFRVRQQGKTRVNAGNAFRCKQTTYAIIYRYIRAGLTAIFVNVCVCQDSYKATISPQGKLANPS